MKNLELKNNGMDLELISLHTFDCTNPRDNVAILRRHYKTSYSNDIELDFVVVRYIEIDFENKTCEWGHGIQYGIDNLTEATQVFISKLQ